MKRHWNILCIFMNCMIVAVLSTNCIGRRSAIVDGKEYRLFTRVRRFVGAQRACRSWGQQLGSTVAGLANVVNSQIQTCLTDMITSRRYHRVLYRLNHFTRGFYIGGNDMNGEGRWRWSNGDPIPFRNQGRFHNWGTYEPNNYFNEDCMLMLFIKIDNFFFGGYTPGKWVDVSCNYRRYYICERELPPPSTTAPPPTQRHSLITRQLTPSTEFPGSKGDWGYSSANGDQLNPENWQSEYPMCGGARQSPVQIDSLHTHNCVISEHSTVSAWGSETSNVKWIIRNTGKTIEIRTEPPSSIYTQFKGSDRKLYVDYMRLIWGEEGGRGTEHQIGNHHFQGELQVYHLRGAGERERHALAFMISERLFVANQNWVDLLRHIGNVQVAGGQVEMTSPPNHIYQLLGDTDARFGQRRGQYITGVGIRYLGSVPHPPCTEDLIWTVYPRPIFLEFHQFNVLRRILGSDGHFITGNARPLQPLQGLMCMVL